MSAMTTGDPKNFKQALIVRPPHFLLRPCDFMPVPPELHFLRIAGPRCPDGGSGAGKDVQP